MFFKSNGLNMNKQKLSWLILVGFCFASCFAAGYGFGYFRVIRDIAIGTVGTLCVLLSLAWFSPKLAHRILLFFALSMTAYFPFGWLFGAPTFKIVGSALETDRGEALEFFGSIPNYVWVLQIAFLLFSILTYKTAPIILQDVKNWGKKAKMYALGIATTLLILPPISSVLADSMYQDDETFFPVTIAGFYIDMANAPRLYWQKKQRMLEEMQRPATWHIQSVQPKYKNYVVIIGESVRSDYMNVYGFPVDNTPFMSKVNGFFLDGYISTAAYTSSSVPGTLSLKVDQSNNNIISLAKSAGFYTAWLSNQGMLGIFSNTVSSFAARSDYHYFTQRGDWEKSAFTSDDLLLPYFQKVLAQDTDKTRLIVLHIMGSHNEFCARLPIGIKMLQYQTKELSCYVTTIRETDRFIEQVVQALQQKNESYSLIYFADHGLKHVGVGSEKTLLHGDEKYENFTVPFAKISSDDTQRTMVKTQRSAFNFLKGFSQWTGIRVQELPIDHYDFFGQQADVAEKGNNLAKINQLPKDPIVAE